MTLIVAPDDGYESYVTTAQAAQYVAAMGRDGWPGDDGAQEAALRQATQYIRLRYAPQTQYIDPLHPDLLAATVEAALRIDVLFTDVEPSATVSESVGPISTTYAAPTNGGQVRLAIVDALMMNIASVNLGGVRFLKRV